MRFSRFVLERSTDVSGVSGTGTVAEGVRFSTGVVALHWLSEFPTSVVFHHRGMESVEAVHGHGGLTEVDWMDDPEPRHLAIEAEYQRMRDAVEAEYQRMRDAVALAVGDLTDQPYRLADALVSKLDKLGFSIVEHEKQP